MEKDAPKPVKKIPIHVHVSKLSRYTNLFAMIQYGYLKNSLKRIWVTKLPEL